MQSSPTAPVNLVPNCYLWDERLPILYDRLRRRQTRLSANNVENRGEGECRDQSLDLSLAMGIPNDSHVRRPGQTVQEQVQEDAGVE